MVVCLWLMLYLCVGYLFVEGTQRASLREQAPLTALGTTAMLLVWPIFLLIGACVTIKRRWLGD